MISNDIPFATLLGVVYFTPLLYSILIKYKNVYCWLRATREKAKRGQIN